MAIEKFPKIFWRLLKETRRKNFTKFLVEVCIMNYEEEFWELRENMDRAWDKYNKNPNFSTNLNYDIALHEYTDFCVEILEKLMEENSDVLARLK